VKVDVRYPLAATTNCWNQYNDTDMSQHRPDILRAPEMKPDCALIIASSSALLLNAALIGPGRRGSGKLLQLPNDMWPNTTAIFGPAFQDPLTKIKSERSSISSHGCIARIPGMVRAEAGLDNFRPDPKPPTEMKRCDVPTILDQSGP